MISLIAVLVCITFVAPQVWAGSKQRHRWEGVAIGVGAAILGHSLIREHHRHMREIEKGRDARWCPPPRPHREGRWEKRPQREGHWEKKRIWTPETYKRVWNPGHYNRKKRWVPGEWIKVIDQPGYWKKERVWVSHR